MARNLTEDALQRATKNWVHSHLKFKKDFTAWHTPNERKGAIQGRRMKEFGQLPGVPDWIFMLDDGAVFFVELKAKRGSLSKTQKEFKEICKMFGVCYYVIRTDCPYEAVKELENIYQKERKKSLQAHIK